MSYLYLTVQRFLWHIFSIQFRKNSKNLKFQYLVQVISEFLMDEKLKDPHHTSLFKTLTKGWALFTIIFKLRLGASIVRVVGLSVCLFDEKKSRAKISANMIHILTKPDS